MKICRISPAPLKKRKTQKAMKTFLTYYNHGLSQKGRINHCLIQPQTSIKKMKNKIKRERWTKYNFKALKTIYKNLINNQVQYNTNKKETIIRKTEYPCSKIASLKQLDLYSNMFIMRVCMRICYKTKMPYKLCSWKHLRFHTASNLDFHLLCAYIQVEISIFRKTFEQFCS